MVSYYFLDFRKLSLLKYCVMQTENHRHSRTLNIYKDLESKEYKYC